MAAGYVRGIQKNGVSACPKHFAANSQELRRMASDSVMDERTLREIYLTGFEIAVKEGKAKSIMSSYNRINGVYANENPHLLQEILRDEWGFQGMVLTDYFVDFGFMDSDRAIRNGNDIMLADYDTGANYLTDTTSATSLLAMRRASKNILFTVVHSRLYEDFSFNNGLMGWQKLLIAADAAVAAAMVVWEVLLIRGYKKKKAV